MKKILLLGLVVTQVQALESVVSVIRPATAAAGIVFAGGMGAGTAYFATDDYPSSNYYRRLVRNCLITGGLTAAITAPFLVRRTPGSVLRRCLAQLYLNERARAARIVQNNSGVSVDKLISPLLLREGFVDHPLPLAAFQTELLEVKKSNDLVVQQLGDDFDKVAAGDQRKTATDIKTVINKYQPDIVRQLIAVGQNPEFMAQYKLLLTQKTAEEAKKAREELESIKTWAAINAMSNVMRHR